MSSFWDKPTEGTQTPAKPGLLNIPSPVHSTVNSTPAILKPTVSSASSFWDASKIAPATLETTPAQTKQPFANTGLGIGVNTVLGLPKAAKDIFFPTRGYSETELAQAKPSIRQKLASVPKFGAEFTSAMGDLLNLIPGYTKLAEKAPVQLADIGKHIQEYGVPKNVDEAKAMRYADVLNVLPMGRVKNVATLAETIAKDANAVRIADTLTKEIPNITPEVAQQSAIALKEMKNVQDVETVLNRLNYKFNAPKTGGFWDASKDEPLLEGQSSMIGTTRTTERAAEKSAGYTARQGTFDPISEADNSMIKARIAALGTKEIAPVETLNTFDPRNFKTAEEYVKAQPAIYHGTPAKFTKFDPEKTPGGTAWFSDNLDAVKGNKVEGSRASGQPWNVMERYIKPNIKLVDRNTPEGKRMADNLMQGQIESEGYRGIKHEADSERGSYVELFHPNEDTVTRAQLTAEWEKGQVPKKTSLAQTLAKNLNPEAELAKANELQTRIEKARIFGRTLKEDTMLGKQASIRKELTPKVVETAKPVSGLPVKASQETPKIDGILEKKVALSLPKAYIKKTENDIANAYDEYVTQGKSLNQASIEEQDAMYKALQEDLQSYRGEDELKILVDKIAAGKIKIKTGDTTAEKIGTLGRGGYMRVFTSKDPMASSLDVIATDISNTTGRTISEGDLLDAIAKRVDEVKIEKASLQKIKATAREARKSELALAKTEAEKAKVLRNIQNDITKELLKKRFSAGQMLKAKVVAEKKGVGLGRIIGRKEVRGVELTKRQELRAKKNAEMRAVIGQTRDRKGQIKNIADHFKLTGGELNSIIGNKNIATMNTEEFNGLLSEMYGRAEQIAQRSDALIQAKGTIYEKQLQRTENLQRAMKLPPIDKMSTTQLRHFDEAMQPYQAGDEFLTTRKLELIDRTDFKGVKTIREAREKMAEKLGMPVADLPNISVSWIDRLSYDSVLAQKDPFFKAFVDGYHATVLEGDGIFLANKKQVTALAREARKGTGLGNAFVPQDKKVIEYLEGANKVEIAKTMTPEQVKLAEHMQEYLTDAYNHMLEMETLKNSTYEGTYFPHIQRGLLESVKEGGVKVAIKEMFDQYKIDESVLNILDQKTGEVLPLEKFFKYAMHRTGEIAPTQNAAKAFLIYAQAFERKKALDKIIPELMTYIDVLTPQSITKGGIIKDDKLATFAKEWINSKKGRPAKLIVAPGSTGDFVLRSLRSFTALKYVSVVTNLPVQLSSQFGVQVGTYVSLGKKAYATGIIRLNTKQGKSIVAKYENFVGESPWEPFIDPSKGLAEKAWTSMYVLFRDAVVRGNKEYLLGSMTKEEFESGTITTKRLAELRTEMGRWLPVEGSSSIIGATSEGKMMTQFRTWAVPPLLTSIDNLAELILILPKVATGKVNPLKVKQVMELWRVAEVAAVVGLVTYAVSIDGDKPVAQQSFTEKVINKALRDSMSMASAIDPRTWASDPASYALVKDFLKALGDIVHMDAYQQSGKGYKEGELKGVQELKRVFVPTMFQGEKLTPAQELYKELKKLPKEKANARLDALEKEDPALSNQLDNLMKDEALGITPEDKTIRAMGVVDGSRAQYIYDQAMKLKTSEERNAYLDDLTAKKIITDKVDEQIQALIRD